MRKYLCFVTMLLASVAAVAQTTCADAIDFDWTGDNTQSASTTVWYRVSLDPLKNEPGKDLRLYINNASATEEAAVQCLVYLGSCSTTPQEKSTVIVAAGHKEITLQRALIEAFNFPKLYIQMTTNQPVVFSASIVPPSSGGSAGDCANAVAFDWTNGHVQNEGTAVTYKVDISSPKGTANAAIRLSLENLANTTATVVGEVAFTCPAVGETNYTKALLPNQKLEKVLNHSFLEALNVSEVYVTVSTSARIRIGASVETESAVVSDNACEGAVDFDWEQGHTQMVGSQWYRVDMATLRSKGDVRLTLSNESSVNTQVTAEVAFACPVTAPMVNKGVQLAAGQTKTKVLTANEVNTLDAALEYVYVKLTTQSQIRFVVQEEAGVPTSVAEALVADRALEFELLPTAVRMQSRCEQQVQVYNLSGVCLFQKGMCANEVVALQLPKGVYVVRYGIEVEKIVVY